MSRRDGGRPCHPVQIIHNHQQFANTSKSKELHRRVHLRMDGQTDMRRNRDDFLGLSHKDPLSFAQTIIGIPPTNDRQFSGRASPSRTGCSGKKTPIKRTRAKTIHTVESSQCFGNLPSLPPPQTSTALLHRCKSLNRGFATILLLAVKPRELNEKPSSPSPPSSLESRAQSSSAELNQREAIKFSYCPGHAATATASAPCPSTACRFP